MKLNTRCIASTFVSPVIRLLERFFFPLSRGIKERAKTDIIDDGNISINIRVRCSLRNSDKFMRVTATSLRMRLARSRDRVMYNSKTQRMYVSLFTWMNSNPIAANSFACRVAHAHAYAYTFYILTQ